MKNLLIIALIGLATICHAEKYALVKDSKVINIIEANSNNVNSIAASLGATAVRSDTAFIGQNYADGVFTSPTPEVVSKYPALTALQAALAAEIDSLNTLYPTLNLTVNDTLATAIPKLFAAGVTKAEANYLNTLYQAIKEAK